MAGSTATRQHVGCALSIHRLFLNCLKAGLSRDLGMGVAKLAKILSAALIIIMGAFERQKIFSSLER